jgi:hypothetical protein
MEVTPALILAMWTAGVAGGAAVVSYWAVVGPGYGWLVSAVVVLIGGATAFTAGSLVGVVATAVALAAGLAARHQRIASILFALASIGFLALALRDGGAFDTISGSLLLGGMTSEMMLGHWFLVDPKLPRWALQRLDVAAAAGVVLDVVVVAALGAFGSSDGVMVAALAVLAVTTALLVVAVWFSLKEAAYSGVMAATGLSYLGVLTTFGVVVVGRLLVEGL